MPNPINGGYILTLSTRTSEKNDISDIFGSGHWEWINDLWYFWLESPKVNKWPLTLIVYLETKNYIVVDCFEKEILKNEH